MSASFQTGTRENARLFVRINEFGFTAFSVPIKQGFRPLPHAAVPESKARKFWQKQILPTLTRAAKAVVRIWPRAMPTVYPLPANCKIAPERA